MATEFDDRDDRTDTLAFRDEAADPGAWTDHLEYQRVQYPDGPNRCTISPVGLTGVARMETWLSANESVFVDLRAWR